MHAVQLTPSHSDKSPSADVRACATAHLDGDGDTGINRSDVASIMAEIAARLLELRMMQGEIKTRRWIVRLSTICNSRQPRAGWLYLRLLTGDLSEIVASHNDHGKELHRTKQGEHKETRQAMKAIALHFPELAQAIAEIKGVG